MAYLIWGLINIGLYLFFIFICFRATKLIREKVGSFAAVVFVFGILSFIAQPSDENIEPGTNKIKQWTFNSQDNIVQNTSNSIHIPIEKTLISQYNLDIQYGQDKTSKMNAPITASSSTEGFYSGTKWLPISIIVNQTNDTKKFEYQVYGIIKWKLLGANIYIQTKTFKGFAPTK